MRHVLIGLIWAVTSSFIFISQIVQVVSYIVDEYELDKEYTELEYIDTPKLKADIQRISFDVSQIRSTVMAPDSILCHVDHSSVAFMTRRVHVTARKEEFDGNLGERLASLIEMESVLVLLTPFNGNEEQYISHTLRRVRDGKATANRVLKEMRVQVENPEFWCS